MSNQSAYFPGTATESLQPGVSLIRRVYIKAASLDRFGMGMLRLGLVIVLVWIGGLKFVSYEADGIVPLVANSPFMSFFYHYPAPEYREHMNKEGQVAPANQRWNGRSYRLARNPNRALPDMAPGLRSGQLSSHTHGPNDAFIPCDNT